MTVSLDGRSLSLKDVENVARSGERVAVAPAALARMAETRRVAEGAVERDEPIYGLTTGVAERKRVRLDRTSIAAFNRNVILNSRVGQGPLAPAEVVRAAMLCLANSYAAGSVGVRPVLAEAIASALNAGFVPRVRSRGSVGMADLAPMADLARDLLAHTGLEPEAGEGLALVSSSAFALGWSALALLNAHRLLDTFDVAGALDLEAFAANLSILHPAVAAARPYPGLHDTCARLAALLAGSSLWAEGAARSLQDPLTFRCLPQVHGAARDAFTYARRQVEIELNAAQCNPLVVPAERRLISVGNFDVLPLAAAQDFMRIALAPVMNSACERLLKMLQAPWSGLPAGLAAQLNTPDDALAEYAVAAQSLTVEARMLAAPVSYELASTCKAEGIEDRTTMAPLAARRLAEMVEIGEGLAAIELVVAAQAVDLRAPAALGQGTGRVYRLVRECIPFAGAGEPAPQDLEPVQALIRSGELAAPAPRE